MAWVIEPKDKEGSVMYNQALEFLSEALDVWPNASVRINFLEKLVKSIQPTQIKEPAVNVVQSLDVMNKVLEKQPHMFVLNNTNQIPEVSYVAETSTLFVISVRYIY